MRVVVLLLAFWLMTFLYFGWAAWTTWPNREEGERQRETSKLYDCHFEGRCRRSCRHEPPTLFPQPPGGSATFLNRRKRACSPPAA
jgi:hypothetical protein